MRQERLTAFTEQDEKTFATCEITEAGDTLLDGTPKPVGVITLYDPTMRSSSSRSASGSEECMAALSSEYPRQRLHSTQG